MSQWQQIAMAAIKDWEREHFQISQLYAVKKAPMRDYHHQVVIRQPTRLNKKFQ